MCHVETSRSTTHGLKPNSAVPRNEFHIFHLSLSRSHIIIICLLPYGHMLAKLVKVLHLFIQ